MSGVLTPPAHTPAPLHLRHLLLLSLNLQRNAPIPTHRTLLPSPRPFPAPCACTPTVYSPHLPSVVGGGEVMQCRESAKGCRGVDLPDLGSVPGQQVGMENRSAGVRVQGRVAKEGCQVVQWGEGVRRGCGSGGSGLSGSVRSSLFGL